MSFDPQKFIFFNLLVYINNFMQRYSDHEVEMILVGNKCDLRKQREVLQGTAQEVSKVVVTYITFKIIYIVCR